MLELQLDQWAKLTEMGRRRPIHSKLQHPITQTPNHWEIARFLHRNTTPPPSVRWSKLHLESLHQLRSTPSDPTTVDSQRLRDPSIKKPLFASTIPIACNCSFCPGLNANHIQTGIDRHNGCATSAPPPPPLCLSMIISWCGKLLLSDVPFKQWGRSKPLHKKQKKKKK